MKIAYRSDTFDKQPRFQILIQQGIIIITQINIPFLAQTDSCTHQISQECKKPTFNR
jgi:hypothetical protein